MTNTQTRIPKKYPSTNLQYNDNTVLIIRYLLLGFFSVFGIVNWDFKPLLKSSSLVIIE